MKRGQTMVFSVASVAGVLVAGVAAMTIWLLLAQPLSVANAVNTGDPSTLVRAMAAALTDAIGSLLRYL
jgi:hypothetical protein